MRAGPQAPPGGGETGVRAGQGRTLARLERILVMVPWLLDHPGADLEEVADRFGVSVAQLADDLDVLGYCGVPGYGGGDLVEVSIFGGRVTVRMADFFRRPLRLSLREALTLVLAGRALESVHGLGQSADLRRALTKVEQVLGGDPSLAIDLRSPGEEHLPTLRHAVQEGRVVHLTYRSESKAETTERDVEPWALTGLRGAWYLQGWCRLAGGPRDFRLDRIRAVCLTGAHAPQDSSVARRRQASPIYEPSPEHETVVLDLRRPAWWAAEWVVCDSVEERGEVRRIRMRTEQLEWVARFVLRLEHVDVIAPPDLADRVAQLAWATLRRYRTSSPPGRKNPRGHTRTPR